MQESRRVIMVCAYIYIIIVLPKMPKNPCGCPSGIVCATRYAAGVANSPIGPEFSVQLDIPPPILMNTTQDVINYAIICGSGVCATL